MAGITGIADTADRLTGIDLLPGFYPLLIEVGVEYHRTIPEAQPDLLSAITTMLYPLNGAFGNSQHRRAPVCFNINTLMLSAATGITKPGNNMARALIGYRKEKGASASRQIFSLHAIQRYLSYILIYGCFNLMLIPARAAQIDKRAKSQEQQQEVHRKLKVFPIHRPT